jgi:hypothetical protein
MENSAREQSFQAFDVNKTVDRRWHNRYWLLRRHRHVFTTALGAEPKRIIQNMFWKGSGFGNAEVHRNIVTTRRVGVRATVLNADTAPNVQAARALALCTACNFVWSKDR